MRIPTYFLLFPLALISASCRRQEVPKADLPALQSSAGEAVLRRVYADCPGRAEAKLLTVVLGEMQETASEEFTNRFSDTGLTLVSPRRLEAGMAEGKVRIFDRETNLPPLILQLSSLTPEKDTPANLQAVAAWTFKGNASRWSYRVLPKPEGGWEVRPIAEIPIKVRNTDWKEGAETKP